MFSTILKQIPFSHWRIFIVSGGEGSSYVSLLRVSTLLQLSGSQVAIYLSVYKGILSANKKQLAE